MARFRARGHCFPRRDTLRPVLYYKFPKPPVSVLAGLTNLFKNPKKKSKNQSRTTPTLLLHRKTQDILLVPMTTTGNDDDGQQQQQPAEQLEQSKRWNLICHHQ